MGKQVFRPPIELVRLDDMLNSVFGDAEGLERILGDGDPCVTGRVIGTGLLIANLARWQVTPFDAAGCCSASTTACPDFGHAPEFTAAFGLALCEVMQ